MTKNSFVAEITFKSTADKEDSIYSDKCNLWVYIKCNNLNYVDYNYLTGNGDPWFCLAKCDGRISW